MKKLTLGFLMAMLAIPLPQARAEQSPKQVQIETRFAEVSHEAERELGVDFNAAPGEQRNLDSKSAPPQAGTTSAAFGDYTGVHNFPGGGLFVEPVPEARNAVTLQTAPVVNPNGTIGLKVDPGVDLTAIAPPPAQQLQSSVIIPVDGTLLITGQTSKPVKAGSGVPVVSKIPLLGRLFSRHDDSAKKKDLVVIVTPHVIKPEETD